MSRQRAAPDLFDDETGSGNGVLGMHGQIVSAHPSLAGGSVAFSVIFGFIAANALFHQPGQHPAPILKTREIASPAVPVTQALPESAAPLEEAVPARTVTTYRIERNDETPTASIPVPNEPQVSAPVETAARPAADPVLTRIQTILNEQGLYTGAIDGLMGPKSAAAIRAWEKTNGYAETGEATAALLDIMDARPSIRSLIGTSEKAPEQTRAQAPEKAPAKIEAQALAPAPAPRTAPVDLASLEDIPAPAPNPRAAPSVTADSRAGQPVTVPAADIPNGPSELVRRIQSGLSNIAYADIAVDGVAGAETRAAISAFERHYRLPVTGEPNEIVLDKLVEIGAL